MTLCPKGANAQRLLIFALLFSCLAAAPLLAVVAAQQRPETYISSVAWSPDGSKIAVGKGTASCEPDTDLYTIQILDVLTHEAVRTLAGSTCEITSIDWSPDGTKLAAASLDDIGTRVWDIQSGQLLATAQVGGQGITSVRWRPPDGLQLADASISNGIGILDSTTGEILDLARIGGNSLDWSPDGSKLVSGSIYENQVYVADMIVGQRIMSLSGHTDVIETVDWSPDGSKLASGSSDNTVRIWDANSGFPLLSLNVPNVVKVRWSPDSESIAAASFDGVVQLWDASTGQLLDVFSYPGRVYTVDWSPDGAQLVYGGSRTDGQDGTLEIVSAPDAFDSATTPADH